MRGAKASIKRNVKTLGDKCGLCGLLPRKANHPSNTCPVCSTNKDNANEDS